MNPFRDRDTSGPSEISKLNNHTQDESEDAPQLGGAAKLCFELKASGAIKKTLSAEISQITPEDIHQFVEGILTEAHTERSAATRVYIAVDEIITNILQYSGAKTLDLTCRADADKVTISFSDDGVPYNPLEREDPDVTLSAEDRSIGGLGIFMVKKTMDAVDYKYRDGRNILTITKLVK